MADARSVAVLAGSRHCGDSKCGIGGIMWDQVKRLHEYHGDVPVEMRLLKLTEEVGEAAEALIGVRGLNGRKGACHTRDDLLDELADVIITAAVAMSAVTGGGVDEAAATSTGGLRLSRRGRTVIAPVDAVDELRGRA